MRRGMSSFRRRGRVLRRWLLDDRYRRRPDGLLFVRRVRDRWQTRRVQLFSFRDVQEIVDGLVYFRHGTGGTGTDDGRVESACRGRSPSAIPAMAGVLTVTDCLAGHVFHQSGESRQRTVLEYTAHAAFVLGPRRVLWRPFPGGTRVFSAFRLPKTKTRTHTTRVGAMGLRLTFRNDNVWMGNLQLEIRFVRDRIGLRTVPPSTEI